MKKSWPATKFQLSLLLPLYRKPLKISGGKGLPPLSKRGAKAINGMNGGSKRNRDLIPVSKSGGKKKERSDRKIDETVRSDAGLTGKIGVLNGHQSPVSRQEGGIWAGNPGER
jgi:hypothetical protein